VRVAAVLEGDLGDVAAGDGAIGGVQLDREGTGRGGTGTVQPGVNSHVRVYCGASASALAAAAGGAAAGSCPANHWLMAVS
jgi:hypothetical protein